MLFLFVFEQLNLINVQDLLRGDSHLFKPVVEADFGQEIFLPADPWQMIKSKKISDVPLIIGITSEEALLFLGGIYFIVKKIIHSHILVR